MTTYIIIASVLSLIAILSYCRNKQAKSKVIHLNESSCTVCQRCVKKCRRKALTFERNEAGKSIRLNADKCTACGDCVTVCKFNCLELVRREHVKS